MSLALGVAALFSVVASAEPAPIDAAAQAVVERTRATKATYSAYYWNWVRDPDGEPRQEWSAEFHRGSLHRVETPAIRVVADCAAKTGSAIDLRNGASRSGPAVAGAACGINANSSVVSLDLLGGVDSRFGLVDTVRMFDAENERVYVVDAAGVLVASEYFALAAGNPQCLQAEAITVDRAIPDGDIFSEESLVRSVVAEDRRSPPTGNYGDLWQGDRRCIEEP